ncbi:SGNH/GDSL hydrolase family protein [Iningainema tapete]|uniref:Lipolytic protein G-D-S-L family n=1 Tax=Iningainema tapete BLCC-T55 TaxID=2748662 RepID=A0A8J6XI04_9CYAN|nr:SGNH/GDSL hydrolase family protein [Iningainema tapete]MBD2771066.1 lipolytic protein G-D-S-L family [Iningainema tapete BLCC-T55]
MRELYLLAASCLLTGLAIPASTLPQVITVHPASLNWLWNVNESTQVKGEVLHKEVSLPESQQGWQASAEMIEPPNRAIFSHQLISGNQLYYQRLAALKAGKIYTRLDDLSSLPEMSVRKHQLTYQEWKSLLAMEASAVATAQGTNRLGILVGDSLSMWFPRTKMPLGKLWLNQGISGDTSSGVLKRISAFSQTKPDVIYIMAGINDLRKGATDETILRNHRLMLRRLRKTHPKSQIVIQSILPTRLPTISNSRIRGINYQLAFIAKQERARYLDLHYWFQDFQGNLREDLTTDGLHLNEQGYDIWSSTLKQVEFSQLE